MATLEKTVVWVKVILCLTGYLLWCLEKCIKYVSKNAYIQVALTNDSFCPAAWNAFTLILKNAHRFGFTATIGFVYSVFGVIFISTFTSFASYLFMTNYPDLGLTSPVAPLIVIIIISGAIGF
jgi:hypothetical protein